MCWMKRIIVSLLLGVLIMNLASGCRKSPDNAPADADTSPSMDTDATNATVTL